MQHIYIPVSYRLNQSTIKVSIQQSVPGQLFKSTKARGGRHVQ